MFYQSSAKQGYVLAQRKRGLLYLQELQSAEEGEKEKLMSLGVDWLRKAEVQKDAQAAYELGKIHESDSYIEKCLRVAYNFYKISANQGYPEAQQALARVKPLWKSEKQRKEAKERAKKLEKLRKKELKKNTEIVSASLVSFQKINQNLNEDKELLQIAKSQYQLVANQDVKAATWFLATPFKVLFSTGSYHNRQT